MSTEIDDLVKKCVELREAGRLEEAILVARRATSIDTDNANAWWQLALAVAEKDDDAAALEYFKQTVELADNFGYGWHRLGDAYKSQNMLEGAVEAWETALEYDDDYDRTRYNLVDVYNSRKLASDAENLFDHLVELETRDSLRTYDYHLLAIAHHNKGNFLNAIPLYKKYLSQKNDVYGYTNLSLAYSSQLIGQELDAADCCNVALRLDPTFEKAKELLSGLEPNLHRLKFKVLEFEINHKLISDDLWFENYLNPFELLQLESESMSELEIKDIQKAKKILLQEIDLEDGIIEWLPNLKIDRSRAIKIADELINETLRDYHLQVFNFKPLVNFLSRGDLSLFLYDESATPTDLLSTLELDEDFVEWLSEIFYKQYDLLFSAALSGRNIDVIEAMLDGRRFVNAKYEDKCFTTGVRYSTGLLNELKVEQKKAEAIKPTIQTIKKILNDGNLGRILETLPPAFQEVQTEAAEIIRQISVDTYNHHSDADLAKEILGMTTNFAKKSSSFKIKMEKDIVKLEELIKEEKENESHLVFGKTIFNITREGVTHGDSFIKASEAETLRWGLAVTNSSGYKTYEFSMVIGGKGSRTIKAKWASSNDIKKQDDLFKKCVSAIFSYIFPNVIDKIRTDLSNGRTVYIGELPITMDGITLKAKGWFSDKYEKCSWGSLRSEINNGNAVITSSVNPKAEASLPLADVDNAWILHILISEGMMK
jgi:tetratricopeptide (TPR) repeat protein